jgi:hypothetical protein
MIRIRLQWPIIDEGRFMEPSNDFELQNVRIAGKSFVRITCRSPESGSIGEKLVKMAACDMRHLSAQRKRIEALGD